MPTTLYNATGSEPLILASQSPRRADLCASAGIIPDIICPADIDETEYPSEHPTDYARRMALGKARHVAGQYKNAFILGADTVVACGRRILPKAEDSQTARACLERLSGRRHTVYGGICIILPSGIERVRLSKSTVWFKTLTEAEKTAYLESAEWDGKAGGYAIQGQAAMFIRKISGSYANIVGLDLNLLYGMLHAAGFTFSSQP